MGNEKKAKGPKRGPGRPSKLEPQYVDQFLRALRMGNYRQVSAEWAGLGYRTVCEWMDKGKTDPDSKYGVFRRQVIEAERSAEIQMVGLLIKGAQSNAKHAVDFLERKFPKRWGKKENVEVSGKDGAPLPVVINLGKAK